MKLAGLIKNDLNMNVQAGNAKETIKKSISKLIMEVLPVLKEVNSYNVTFDLDTMYTNKSNPINTLFVIKEQDIVIIRVKVRNNYLITAKAVLDTDCNLLGDVEFNFEEYIPDYTMLLYIIDKLKAL
jgi:hypothetical protein